MTTAEAAVMPAPPNFTLVENEEQYHARSKSGDVMSSGMLKKFRDCPYIYHLSVKGVMQDKDSAAYRLGSATHKMVLEGRHAFDCAYTVGGPINPKTDKAYGVETKAYADWLKAEGITKDQVVTPEELVQMSGIATAVREHKHASALLHFGWPELVMRAHIRDVPCQIRMDWLTNDADGNFVIVDLKTTENFEWFEKDSYRYGYLYQFALYRDVFQSSGFRAQFAVVAVEKIQPYRVGVWMVPEETLDYYSAINESTLDKYRYCIEHDEWPTGYEEPRAFKVPE